jgi:hypothetical protein
MQSRAYSTFAVFAPTFGFSGFSLGPQRWVWVGSCNPKPSVGSRFRTQTQLWVGFGLGWVWVFWVLAMSNYSSICFQVISFFFPKHRT